MQQAFAAPDADNSHPLWITPVHNAERRMYKLPQERLIEFGHHSAHVRVVGQRLDTLKHFLHKPHPDCGHTLFPVPCLHLLEIAECGFGETDGHRGHGAT